MWGYVSAQNKRKPPLLCGKKKKGRGGVKANATSLLYIRDVFCERGPEFIFFCFELEKGKSKEQKKKKNVEIKNASK